MNGLWRRTWQLCRRHPVLWFPVIVADPINYASRVAMPIVDRRLDVWILTTQSVLGPAIGYDPRDAWRRGAVYALAFVLGTASRLISVGVYVVAAMVTAKLVVRLIDTPIDAPEPEGEVRVSFASHAGKALWLSCLVFVVSALLSVVYFWLIYYFGQFGHGARPLLSRPYFMALCSIPMYLVLAYAATPACLRLLAAVTGADGSVDTEAVSAGRRAAALAGMACACVQASLMRADYLPVDSVMQRYMLVVGCSLAAALPFIPLFIAFGVLVAGSDASREQEDGRADGVPQTI